MLCYKILDKKEGGIVSYQELVEKVKLALENDKDIKITAAEIEHLTPQQIVDIQKMIDEYSINYIKKALAQNLINKEAAEYMIGIYGNSMKTTRCVYKNITEMMLKSYRPHKLKLLSDLGEEAAPEEINAIDLETGIVEENKHVGEQAPNMSRYKEYRAKHITPFTNMRLTFYDLRDNPIFVIMPGLKNIRRAIDKIKMPVIDKKTGKEIAPGGKYYYQYMADVKKVKKECGDDKSLLKRKLKKVLLPHERLNDIVRLTIMRKYYMDTEETIHLFSQDKKYGVIASETKDGFNSNSSNSKDYNQKNYRDKKMYLHLNVNGQPFSVECQIKITKLFEGDPKTHGVYAGETTPSLSEAENILISAKNTKNYGLRFWEENLKKYKGFMDRLIAKNNVFKYKMTIQKINKEYIRAYNLQVLDKAFRLEDFKQANGKEYDAEAKNIHTGKKEKIYQSVAEFISKNFIYRPFKAYDKSNAFNVTDEELKSMGLLINADQMQDFSERYSSFIVPKYNGRIEGNDAAYFGKGDNRFQTELMFQKYGYNEQDLDTNVPDKEEIEALAERGFKYEDSASEYIYKRLDNKRRNYHNKQKQKQKHDARRIRAQLNNYDR